MRLCQRRRARRWTSARVHPHRSRTPEQGDCGGRPWLF